MSKNCAKLFTYALARLLRRSVIIANNIFTSFGDGSEMEKDSNSFTRLEGAEQRTCLKWEFLNGPVVSKFNIFKD